MTTLYSTQGTIRFPIKAGNSLIVTNISGTETVSGSSIAREDASSVLGSGVAVYGPQSADSTILLSTSGQCEYEIRFGDPTPSRNLTANFDASGGQVPDSFTNQVLTQGGARLQPYIGQVATRAQLLNWTNGTNKQMMSRTLHKARENIYKLKIAIPNWYVATQVSPNDGSEANNGASTTCTASIEYPVGTFTQVLFSGSAIGTNPAGGTLLSDWVNVTIPNGAEFYVRLWTNNATGLVYQNNHVAQNGEMNAYGVTTPDLTMGGSFTGASNIIQAPCAIIGYATQPSYFLAGDSRCLGITDSADISRNVGELARTLGNKFAYINAGIPSDRVQFASTLYTKRLALSQYCSHIVSNYGINDNRSDGGNRTSAQVMADYVTFSALFGGKPFYACTVAPYTSSSDSWATTANQSTAVNTNHAQLLVMNDAIRAGGVTSAWGVIDIWNAVTTSGVWTPNLTGDGLHENRRGALVLQASNAVNVAAIG